MELYRILNETSATLSEKVADSVVLPKEKPIERMIKVSCVSNEGLSGVTNYILSINSIKYLITQAIPDIETDAFLVKDGQITERRVGKLILENSPYLEIYSEEDLEPIGELNSINLNIDNYLNK